MSYFSYSDNPVCGRLRRTDEQDLLHESRCEQSGLSCLSYDELADAYREQMEALLEGGVDAFADRNHF